MPSKPAQAHVAISMGADPSGSEPTIVDASSGNMIELGQWARRRGRLSMSTRWYRVLSVEMLSSSIAFLTVQDGSGNVRVESRRVMKTPIGDRIVV